MLRKQKLPTTCIFLLERDVRTTNDVGMASGKVFQEIPPGGGFKCSDFVKRKVGGATHHRKKNFIVARDRLCDPPIDGHGPTTILKKRLCKQSMDRRRVATTQEFMYVPLAVKKKKKYSMAGLVEPKSGRNAVLVSQNDCCCFVHLGRDFVVTNALFSFTQK